MERVERVHSYHQRSKTVAMGTRPAPPEDPAYRPGVRIFADCPKIALPTSLLDAPTGMLTVLNSGQEAVPDSMRLPPQDLKTLATWLYYAAGETVRPAPKDRTSTPKKMHARPFPDGGEMLAVEIYVAVFGMADLPAGLYHFSPREFSLRRLREGAAALLQLKKGRPDLEFLKTLPAAILVAGNYWRAAWRFGRRGYRTMLLDVGQMVQNLVAAGAGLGMQTMTRLRMNDWTSRDLIGMKDNEPLASAESIHAMVAWADRARAPIELPPRAAAGKMAAIARSPLSEKVLTGDACEEPLFVHQDCVAPGVAVQQIRPPMTELGPLPATHSPAAIEIDRDPAGGLPVRQVLLERQPAIGLSRQAITRVNLLAINRLAFRGGSFFPLFPDGPHLATVRPFWIVQEVSGLETGLWYYHPPADKWHQLSKGTFRREAKYIAGDVSAFGDASAVCVLTANTHTLMTQGGPDTYRLANIEAGIAAQRMYLAATSLGLGCLAVQDFYDEDARGFFGLGKTGWEAMYIVAIGVRAAGDGGREERARALGQVITR